MPEHAPATMADELQGPYLPPEVWIIMGEQLDDKRSLQALVCVSKQFSDIFLPFLHATLYFTLSKYSPHDLEELGMRGLGTLESRLKYTKCLVVDIPRSKGRSPPEGLRRTIDYHYNSGEDSGDETRPGPPYRKSWNKYYAKFLVDLIEAMPELKEFRWQDHSVRRRHEYARIFCYEQLVKALGALKNLKHLSIEFANWYREGHEWNTFNFNCFICLDGFSCLTTLELYHLNGEFQILIMQLTGVLLRNPGLKKLGLGMALNLFRGSSFCIYDPRKRDLFKKLCIRYAKQEGKALSLHTLRLGHGFFVVSKASADEKNYVPCLIRLRELQALHIWNGRAVANKNLTISEISSVYYDWNQLSEAVSLRQVWLPCVHSKTIEYLNTRPKLKEIFITDESENHFLGRYPQTDLSALHPPLLDALIINVDRSAEEVVNLHYICSLMGQSHYSMPVCEPFVTDEKTRKQSSLAGLRDWASLTHLRLEPKRFGNCFKLKEFNTFPVCNIPGSKPKDRLLYIATVIASKVPRLQYIMIKARGFKVISRSSPLSCLKSSNGKVHDDDESKSDEGDTDMGGDDVVLKELTLEEGLQIDIFARRSFEKQSGLWVENEKSSKYTFANWGHQWFGDEYDKDGIAFPPGTETVVIHPCDQASSRSRSYMYMSTTSSCTKATSRQAMIVSSREDATTILHQQMPA